MSKRVHVRCCKQAQAPGVGKGKALAESRVSQSPAWSQDSVTWLPVARPVGQVGQGCNDVF